MVYRSLAAEQTGLDGGLGVPDSGQQGVAYDLGRRGFSGLEQPPASENVPAQRVTTLPMAGNDQTPASRQLSDLDPENPQHRQPVMRLQGPMGPTGLN